MASSLRKPDVFVGNVPENLRIFFLEFDCYVLAAHPSASEITRIQIMLNLAGRDALERSKEFTFESEDAKKKLENWKQKFYEVCQPMKNIIVLRHGFFSKHQKEGENFNSFLTSLRSKAAACEFGDMRDEMLRDRIVCGIHDSKTRSLLFAEPKLTLRRAIEICELQEGAVNAQKELQNEAEVSIVKTKKYNKAQHRSKDKTATEQSPKCKYCGYSHDRAKCPAFRKTCAKCGRKNHFASMCNSDTHDRSRREGSTRKKVQEIEYEDHTGRNISDDPDGNNFVIDAIDLPANNEINVTAVYNKHSSFELKIDSGAKCNVISIETIKTLKTTEKIRITSCNSVTLVTYSGDTMKTLGTCELPLTIAGVDETLLFQVVTMKKKALIGVKDALKLKLITTHPEVHELNDNHGVPPDIYDKYGELFSDLPGTLPVVYRMKLRPDAQPVIRPPRRVPVARHDKVKQELEKMEQHGIIKKVTQATEWVSSMVAAEKKNTDELRICIDPRDLNQALMRPHHALKTVDDILSDVSGAKVFSKLDAKSGFWHIKLDEKSSYYTTFNTPFGRYRFIKMPYGITQ